jgi:hypothetical protein
MGLRRENWPTASRIDLAELHRRFSSVTARSRRSTSRRQEARDGEVVERREELAPREIARGAEDDEDARRGRALGLEADAPLCGTGFLLTLLDARIAHQPPRT